MTKLPHTRSIADVRVGLLVAAVVLVAGITESLAAGPTPASFARDLVKVGYARSIEQIGDEVRFKGGLKFDSIRAQSARAELCQRLLAHARTTQPATVRAVLIGSDGVRLGTCTQSGYTVG